MFKILTKHRVCFEFHGSDGDVNYDRTPRFALIVEHVVILHPFPLVQGSIDRRERNVVQFRPVLSQIQLLKVIKFRYKNVQIKFSFTTKIKKKRLF